MAKKKNSEEVKDEKKPTESEGEASETEAKKPDETGEAENKLDDGEGEKKSEEGEGETGKTKVKPIYKNKKMQSMYDKLRADGKTDTQARQIVMLKSR